MARSHLALGDDWLPPIVRHKQPNLYNLSLTLIFSDYKYWLSKLVQRVKRISFSYIFLISSEIVLINNYNNNLDFKYDNK